MKSSLTLSYDDIECTKEISDKVKAETEDKLSTLDCVKESLCTVDVEDQVCSEISRRKRSTGVTMQVNVNAVVASDENEFNLDEILENGTGTRII